MIKRRTFLRWIAASSTLPLLQSACGDNDESERTFPQGVASGDPTPDGVLLWTRVEPAGDSERVQYEIAADPDFRRLEGTGVVEVGGDTDHCARIEVTGLAAGTTYWYRFTARGVRSRIGRTRTAPVPEADAESTRNGLAIIEIGADAVDVQFVLVGDVTSPAPSATETVAFRTPRGWRTAGQPAVVARVDVP